MKSKIILIVVIFILTFSACKKCETCTAYQVKNGSLLTTPDRYAQPVKLCDKTDITAYESMDSFLDGDNKPAKFICQ